MACSSAAERDMGQKVMVIELGVGPLTVRHGA
jgi:hypothetical protein